MKISQIYSQLLCLSSFAAGTATLFAVLPASAQTLPGGTTIAPGPVAPGFPSSSGGFNLPTTSTGIPLSPFDTGASGIVNSIPQSSFGTDGTGRINSISTVTNLNQGFAVPNTLGTTVFPNTAFPNTAFPNTTGTPTGVQTITTPNGITTTTGFPGTAGTLGTSSFPVNMVPQSSTTTGVGTPRFNAPTFNVPAGIGVPQSPGTIGVGTQGFGTQGFGTGINPQGVGFQNFGTGINTQSVGTPGSGTGIGTQQFGTGIAAPGGTAPGLTNSLTNSTGTSTGTVSDFRSPGISINSGFPLNGSTGQTGTGLISPGNSPEIQLVPAGGTGNITFPQSR